MKKLFLFLLAILLFPQAALSLPKVSEQQFINNINTCTPSYFTKKTLLQFGSHSQSQISTESIIGNVKGKCRMSITTIYGDQSSGLGQVCDLNSKDKNNYYNYRRKSLNQKSNDISINTSDFYYVKCISYSYKNKKWVKDGAISMLSIPKNSDAK